MDLGLRGKKALVTGASKGIGQAVVHALCGEGAEVLASSRNKENLDALAAMLSRRNAAFHTASCDLAQADSRQELIEQTFKKLGQVDILVHNVGGPRPTSVQETTPGDWQAGFDQLFQSVAELNAAFVPGMKERRNGRILCVTSLSVQEPIENLAVSNGIRSAVTAMLKTLADELASYEITVNCVAPGAIATDRLNDLMNARIARSGLSEEEYMAGYLQAIPMGRLGSPEEFASVVAFLASARASYITGSTISVDGGKRRSTY